MATNGWATLGSVLGGGINREGAFMEGQFRSAKTEDAIARAKIQRDIAASREGARKLDFNDPNVALADIILGGLGSDYSAAQSGRLGAQEFGFRKTAADPETDALTRTRSLGAVLGKPYSDIEAVGSKGFTNITDETPTVKPLSDALGLPVDQPNDIAVYEYYSRLPTAEAKEDFLRTKRGIDRIYDIGEVPTMVTSGPTTRTAPLSTLTDEASATATIQGARTTATNQAEADVKAIEALPQVEARADQMIDLLGQLEVHPGLPGSVGARFGAERIAGTKESDFIALADQLSGQQFLQGFETMRGAGTITEVEGREAKNAISTLQNRNQSEASYLAAIKRLKDVTAAGKLRARQRASRASQPSPATALPHPVAPAQQPRKMIGGKQYVQIDGQWYEDDGT